MHVCGGGGGGGGEVDLTRYDSGGGGGIGMFTYCMCGHCVSWCPFPLVT